MLPISISNGICSLSENEDRLTLSIDMIISEKGEVISSNIYKSIINSKKRMTYHKVECVLDNKDEKVLKEYSKFKKDIFLMYELAEILKNKRNKNGSINLNVPETFFELNDKGEVTNVMPYEIGKSNSIIEEFMLIANETIAKTFFKLDAPFIYRIHETPELEKLRELNILLKNLGTSIKGINNIHPKSIDTAIQSFKEDINKYTVVSKMVLKTLKLAKYSDVCLGHFGLNFKYYCHFTSPIRRYPDLFIHRVISKYIEDDYNLEIKAYEKLKNKAHKYAIISSDAEKISTETERDFDDLYMARYMNNHLGDEYEGIISSVTSFGIYVKLDNTVEGLVSLMTLEDDYYVYYEKEMALIGERTKKRYDVGKRVKVVVQRVNIEQRQIDFAFVED